MLECWILDHNDKYQREPYNISDLNRQKFSNCPNINSTSYNSF